MTDAPTNPPSSPKLTTRQLRFVEEYCIDGNATKAALNAGYSEKTAYSIGWENLRKPEIAEAVTARLNELGMSAERAIKILSDAADTRLQDYLVIRTVERPTTIRKPLLEIIDEINAEIAFENKYAELAELEGDEKEKHDKQQRDRKRKTLRLQLELERNPDACLDVPGEPELVEQADIDLVALARAREKGNIKKLSFTEFGPKVEMYAADAAADKILQLHGRYKAPIDDNPKATTNVYILPDGTSIPF